MCHYFTKKMDIHPYLECVNLVEAGQGSTRKPSGMALPVLTGADSAALVAGPGSHELGGLLPCPGPGEALPWCRKAVRALNHLI